MKITKTNILSNKQISQIEETEGLCQKAEKLENRVFLTNEINIDKNIPAFFLAYENDILIGFLTIFFPTKKETEISAFTHPNYRKQGVFTMLDLEARKVIAENGLGNIIYSVETKSKSASQVLKHRNLNIIQRSEYRMELNIQKTKKIPLPIDESYCARRLTPENIVEFPDVYSVYPNKDLNYFNTIITSDDRLGYVFYRNDTPIGIFVVGLEDKNMPFICGVAISQKERGKGYGKFLVEQACKIAAKYSNILCLDVDSENPIAFHIYQSIGFEITFQVDYYKDNRC